MVAIANYLLVIYDDRQKHFIDIKVNNFVLPR